MKGNLTIAFLLTAYGNAENVNRFLFQVLTYKYSYVFIHVDKTSKINRNDIIHNERVYIMDKSYNVEWGDYSQIESVLELMKYARNHRNFDYYSLHSESDMLVRPISELIEFLNQDEAYAYTWCYPLPYSQWQYGGGLGRIALYWPKIFRKKYKWNSPIRYIRSIYGKLHTIHIIKGKNLPSEIEFWGRCDWFTLSGECVNYIIQYVASHIEYVNLFKNSLIGSEIFFTTLVHMDDNHKIVSDNNLRYIDFEHQDYRKPGSPKELGMDDIKSIQESGRFFARKFDSNHDSNVIRYYMQKTGIYKNKHRDK